MVMVSVIAYVVLPIAFIRIVMRYFFRILTGSGDMIYLYQIILAKMFKLSKLSKVKRSYKVWWK